jgi:hypothetical protein
MGSAILVIRDKMLGRGLAGMQCEGLLKMTQTEETLSS